MWRSGRDKQNELVGMVFEWLDTATEPPIPDRIWRQILFVLQLLPTADSRYGDVRLGFRVEFAGNEYLAIATEDEKLHFVAELESKELSAVMPDDITVVRWDKSHATVTLSTGEVRYQVRFAFGSNLDHLLL